MKKKLLYICMVLVMVITFTCSNFVIAAAKPRVAVGGPSSGTCEVGGTIRYPVNIYNDPTSVNFTSGSVVVHNGSATISVEGSGTSRTVVLSNVQGSIGASVYITINAGIASNDKGVSLATPQSSSFTIVATVNNDKPSNPGNNNNNGNNNGNTTLPPNNNNNNSGGNNNSNGNNNNGNTQNNEPPKEEKKDEVAPTIEIGKLSDDEIKLGEEISFEIQYKDETEMGEITLDKKDITCYGFSADIKISGEGNKRTVTLSNIQGHLGGLKYVKIAKGTAKDKAGNVVKDGGKTAMFKVIDNDTKNKPDDWVENPNTGR